LIPVFKEQSMSLEILEKVKEFLVRLVKDQAFRAQLQTDKIDEVRKVMQAGGYNFSKEEFETAALKILELKELDQFHELSEEELVGAVGGIAQVSPDDLVIQPMYGVIWWPPKGCWRPCPKPVPLPRPIPGPQPMYGVIIDPVQLSMDSQSMDGVIIASDR
jgi:predicted ribosomally synthesized peptide with nif11-like leader